VPETPSEDAPPPRDWRVVVTYCTGCRWMLRAAWTAQEMLSTFEGELAEVALRPGSGGVFEVRVARIAAGAADADAGELIWSRQRDGGFPEMKRLKQLVRDAVAPDRDLGHVDR